MKVHWVLLLVILFWSPVDVEAQSGLYAVYPVEIELNASTYNVNVSLMFHEIGDYLTSIGVNYNDSEIEELVSVTFDVQGSYSRYVAIDDDGRATVKEKFPRATIYPVYFSALVIARISGNITVAEDLEGRILVRVLEPLYFGQPFINLNLPSNAVAGDHVFDLKSLLILDREHFVAFQLRCLPGFLGAYFGYFHYRWFFLFIIRPNGIIALRRAATDISPGSLYYLHVQCYYTLTMRNGTNTVGILPGFFYMHVLGCPSMQEGNVEWPTMSSCGAAAHPCVKYHPSFKGGSVVRKCSAEAETLNLDFSNCSVLEKDFGAKFAVVWFTISGTSGSTYTSTLPAIKRTVTAFFPPSKVTAVREFTAYRSHRYYGFTMALSVNLVDNTTQSDLAAAYQSLRNARSIGYGLHYNSASRGLRAFMPSAGCQYYFDVEDNYAQFIPICQQTASSQCKCVDNVTITPTPTVSCPTRFTVTEEPEPTVTPSPTPQPDIHFTQNHYEAKLFAGQPNSGAEVTTIALKVEHPQLISSWTHNFGLNGFYSDFFSIGHTSGIITVASTVTPKLYSFDVTAFITGNFSNGTTFTNFTEADVSILVHDGAYFRKQKSTITVGADLSKHTPVISLKNELMQDKATVKDILSYQFTNGANGYFKVNAEGVIITTAPLSPMTNRKIPLTVQVTFLATDLNGVQFHGQASTRVTILVMGCTQEEGGGHVWPVMHPCGIATVNCSEFDTSFDRYGVIRRQCTKEAYWLAPDFSQCRLKEGAKPFVLLWVTFVTWRTSTQHWQSSYIEGAINELRLYMRTLPVSSITVHYNKKSKVVTGHVQSFKITLQPQGPFNDTDLQSLKQTISLKSRINYRLIHRGNNTFGVLGFVPKDYCPRFNGVVSSAHYMPVCSISSEVLCSCEEDDLFEPSDCCTMDGKQDRSGVCNATTLPPKTCSKVRAALTASFQVSSRQLNISWIVTSGQWPDIVSINILFRGFHAEQQFDLSQSTLTTSTSISGLLPSTAHVITVTGSYNEPGCSPVYITYVVKTSAEENKGTIVPFQMLLSGINNCAELKANLQSKVRQQIVSGIQKSDSSFSDDLMGWLFMECPSGLSPSSAVISSWIYGSEGNPASKYIKSMQTMADKSTAIEAGTQKLSMDPACGIALTVPTPPDQACRGYLTAGVSPLQLTPANGTSIAGTVVGIIIGFIACVLSALIVIVLILKYKKTRSAGLNAIPSITLQETEQTKDEDALLE